MDVSSQIGLMVINTIAGLYLFIVVLRFLLQAARANFYNPISQFVVKATAPVLNPLRKIVPGLGGFDWASIVLAVMIQTLVIAATMVLSDDGYPITWQIIIWAFLAVSGLILKIYFWGTIILVIASWIAPHANAPAIELVHQILDPISKRIRRILPEMQGLDLSPIFILMSISIANIVMTHICINILSPIGFVPFGI